MYILMILPCFSWVERRRGIKGALIIENLTIHCGVKKGETDLNIFNISIYSFFYKFAPPKINKYVYNIYIYKNYSFICENHF